jgi:hypothetical protein
VPKSELSVKKGNECHIESIIRCRAQEVVMLRAIRRAVSTWARGDQQPAVMGLTYFTRRRGTRATLADRRRAKLLCTQSSKINGIEKAQKSQTT